MIDLNKRLKGDVVPLRWHVIQLTKAALVSVVLAALVFWAHGCGSTLPADTMTKFASTLETTKLAFKTLCNPIRIGDKVQCESPDLALQCDLAGAYLDSAIGVYTQLNDELKE